MNRITLTGCAPDTLIHYLKALGVLRLVGEQFDQRVRGAWHGSAFVIETERTKDELVDFFLNRYRPTPIVAPWNNGSGFHTSGKGKKGTTLPAIKNSTTPRLKLYRETIEEAEKLLSACMTPEIAALESAKRSEALKPILIPACRNRLPDDAIRWIDAVVIIADQSSTLLPPILGSGGNDGNLDFSLTFMGRLAEVIALDDSSDTASGDQQLRASLFGGEAAGVIFSPGHFHPAGVGGVNATTGLEAAFLANPWDYVLAVEGVLMFANAVTRRLGAETNAGASFPFTARMTATGFGTATTNDDARYEMWLPLWSRMTNIEELKFIFSEGRARFRGGKGRERGEPAKNVRSGLDFARAVVELGVDRGIDSFQRYGFIKRIGKMHLATSLGHFEVPRNKNANTYAALIAEVDGWLERVRKADSPPPRLAKARRQVEDAIFALCATGEREHLTAMLLALGQTQFELARSKKYQDIKDKKYIPPLASLTVAWADECDDGTTEYRIACALASIVDRDGLAPLRVNLEPVEFSLKERKFKWSANDVRVVWGTGTLAQNLALVLRRRWIDARREDLWSEAQRGENKAVEGENASVITHARRAMRARRFVRLNDVAEFVNGKVDENRIEKLLRALMLVNWNWRGAQRRLLVAPDEGQGSQPNVPAYALLKLLFLSGDVFKRESADAHSSGDGSKPHKDFFKPYSSTFAGVIKHEPSIITLLLTNNGKQIGNAFKRAAQRLRISGFAPFTDDFYLDERHGARLAAALLIPLANMDTNALCRAILRPPDKDSTTSDNGEE